MATIRQKKAVDRIVENHGVIGRSMVEAGYKPNTAKNPKNLTESEAFKTELKPLLDRLTEDRDRAIRMMKGKISKAKYRDLTDATDKLTKNIQLLSGGSTERIINIQISQEIATKNDINQPTKPDSEGPDEI